MKIYDKCRKELIRKICASRPHSITFKKINQIVKGWINYFKIGRMKIFITKFGQWLRHKIRIIILKQWKTPPTIYRNLRILNIKFNEGFDDEIIYAIANSRDGWYKKTMNDVVNFILNPRTLAIEKGDRPGLVNPLEYYLR